MSIHPFLEWLEATPVGVLIKESPWGFPITVAIHIMAMMLSVGTLVWFDLRLLGVGMTGYRASLIYRRLMPWMFTGFALMFITGLMLVTAYATAAYDNLYFRIKVSAMVLAAINAFVYHRHTERRIAEWDDSATPPRGARVAGLVSICVWATVIMAGRMMSYTMF
jgi:hypothetical protein